MVTFSSNAKWILSGEHSVVRGGKAIAFPLHNYVNSVTFEKINGLRVVTDQTSSAETIISLLRRATEFLGIPFENISGCITVDGDIPLKAGLGSSAAVCVNIANLFKYCGICNDVLKLAMHLEDKFHKKSSGLDIAVTLENKPIIFKKNRVVEFLEPKFWPCMILTYSGEKSITYNCAEIVKNVFLKNEKLAHELDEQMNFASDLCESALKNTNFDKLKEGITIGNEVFFRWKLCNSSMSAHMKKLISIGAVAAKPVGSGLGGYILSLWEEKPRKYDESYLTLEKP